MRIGPVCDRTEARIIFIMKKQKLTKYSVPGVLMIAVILIAAMLLLSGCGEPEEPTVIEQSTPEPTEAPTPEPTQVPYVEFSFGKVDRGTTELRPVSITEDDLLLLPELKELKLLDGRACDNGPLLSAFSKTVDYPVLWSIKLGDRMIPCDETEIMVSPTVKTPEEVIRALEDLPEIRSLDLRANTFSNEQLTELLEARPDIEFRYRVNVQSYRIDNDAEEIELPAKKIKKWNSLREELAMLKDLKHVTVTGALSPDEAARLLNSTKDTNYELSYSIAFNKSEIASDEEVVDISGLSPSAFDDIAMVLQQLPKVKKVNLMTKKGTTKWTLEDAERLMNIRDSLLVDFKMEAFGVTFSLADEVVSFNDIDLRKKLDEVKELLPHLRRVERLEMMNCKIDNETMAALRDEFPQPKIVWSVTIGGYRPIPTDAIMIKLSAAGARTLQDKHVKALKYCRELKYIDLGHNKLHNLEFVAYMPDLEVCIMYDPISSLKGIENCKKLEYFECFSCMISDLTPLASCTELKHLNLCYNKITDITPLYGLTKLERLWISRNKIPNNQIEKFKRLVPGCVVNTTTHDPTGEGWRKDKDAPDGYAPRYALLRKQFLYDETEHRYVRFFEEYILRNPDPVPES